MGSQFRFVARRNSKDGDLKRKAKREVVLGFVDYLRDFGPHYAVSCAARVHGLSVLEREGRFRQQHKEAMRFYSESQMR